MIKTIARNIRFGIVRANFEVYTAYNESNAFVVKKNFSLFKEKTATESRLSDLLCGQRITDELCRKVYGELKNLYLMQKSYKRCLHKGEVIFENAKQRAAYYEACEQTVKALKKSLILMKQYDF